jgi:hypothetical protein
MICLQTKTAWLSTEITYGLYLSDHSILDAVDTELVVLSGIMMQNLPRETGWHLRGTRRIGVSFEDVEVVQQCVSSGFFRHPCFFPIPDLRFIRFDYGQCFFFGGEGCSALTFKEHRSRKWRRFVACSSTEFRG